MHVRDVRNTAVTAFLYNRPVKNNRFSRFTNSQQYIKQLYICIYYIFLQVVVLLLLQLYYKFRKHCILHKPEQEAMYYYSSCYSIFFVFHVVNIILY